MRRVLSRNTLLVNQKKTCSYRCMFRKSRVGPSSCNDVTYFSHRCCDVGFLVETALLNLEVSCWRFLEAEFPLDARVTLVVLELLVLYNSAIGPSAQARDTGRLGEEERADSNLRKMTILRRERWCCSFTKKEIMSLTLDVKVILNLWARIMCVLCRILQDLIHPSAHTELAHMARKKTHPVPECTYRIGVGLDTFLIPILVNSYHCTDSSGGIITYSRYPTKMRWWLLRVGVSLASATSELTLQSGLITHLASDLSWACQKEVQMYGIFVSSLHHSSPQMKDQHGLNEEKTFMEKNSLSIECL